MAHRADHRRGHREGARTIARRLDHVITVVESGDLSVNTPQVERQLKRLERAHTGGAAIFVGLVIGGAVCADQRGPSSWSTTAYVAGIIMMGLSALPFSTPCSRKRTT